MNEKKGKGQITRHLTYQMKNLNFTLIRGQGRLILKVNENKKKFIQKRSFRQNYKNRFEGKIRQRSLSKPTVKIIQARDDQSQNQSANTEGWIDMIKYYNPSL